MHRLLMKIQNRSRIFTFFARCKYLRANVTSHKGNSEFARWKIVSVARESVPVSDNFWQRQRDNIWSNECTYVHTYRYMCANFVFGLWGASGQALSCSLQTCIWINATIQYVNKTANRQTRWIFVSPLYSFNSLR